MAVKPLVSFIIPCKNAKEYIDECFQSILAQDYPLDRLEASVYDDGSSDGTRDLCRSWGAKFHGAGVKFVYSERDISGSGDAHVDKGKVKAGEDNKQKQKRKKPTKEERKRQRTAKNDNQLSLYRRKEGIEHDTGVAYARNQSLKQCSGDLICILDADDVNMETRVSELVQAYQTVSVEHGSEIARRTLFGSQFSRIPEDATPRYTQWSNGLSMEQLMSSRFRECTIACPTWMLSRNRIVELGYFDASDWRSEDLLLFYKHIEWGGMLHKIMKPLVKYRYLAGSASFKLHRKSLLHVKIESMQRTVLNEADGFFLIGSGIFKGVKEFFRALQPHMKRKVLAFVNYEVDYKSGSASASKEEYYIDDLGSKVPIVAFDSSLFVVSQSTPALILIPIMRTHGLEDAIAGKKWVEGSEYYQVA